MNRAHRINQEIEHTLGCLDGNEAIGVSAGFAETLTERFGSVGKPGAGVYHRRWVRTVGIALMIILNIAVSLTWFTPRDRSDGFAASDIQVVAGEYSMGQGEYMSF